jgi:ATP-dependent helicase HepA
VNQQFIEGQRWLSQAEPDLGLGTVVAVDGRQVTMEFPVAAVKRRYAVAGAPLLRLRYAPGDRIEDREGQSWKVEAVDEQDGLLTYRCTATADGSAAELPERMLDPHVQVNRPHDRLLARRIDGDVWFGLRLQAWTQNARLWASPVFGFAGPRIEWLPHQLYIASEVASRAAPRVLLADEVGLGKTIEAGLILHRLVMTERVRRVLLVVPESLIHQWLVEMLRRFNLTFAVFDGTRFDAAENDGLNPFEQSQRILCSEEFLTGDARIAEAVRQANWDLLLVDEAHHLAWEEGAPSAAYRLVEDLARATPSVLLLTATPEQLGRAGHFGRLRLLDPQRFHDYHAFVAEEHAFEGIAEIATCLLTETPLSKAQRTQLVGLLGAEADGPAQAIIERLIDRHGTGRVLFRNTRQAISGFPSRALSTYPLPAPAAYATDAALVAPERGYGDGWAALDPRATWLIDLCRGLAPDKLLVICASASTVVTLRDHLAEKAALKATAFHEAMDIVARDRAAAYFAEPEDGAQVLICSEIGSEGRNFQFAHHLVMFDLPFEPELLEQRIGRLDRIGQRDTIRLHVPYLQGTAGEVLMRWYRDALGSFEAICPAAAAVHEQLRDRLLAAMADPAVLPDLLDEGRALTARLNRALEQGRDRLLELHSNRPEIAAGLIDTLDAQERESSVRSFMNDYWDAFGVEHEPGVGAAVVLRAGAHMLSEHFPGLIADGMTVTFDRTDALDHEDRQFLTWEHPMVRGCVDGLVSGGLGGAAVAVCRHPDYRTGTVLYETLFIVDCVAPAALEIRRFLPPTVLRLVMDPQGEDRAAALSHAQLSGVCLANNRKLLDTVIHSQRDRIDALLQRAEELAGEQAAERVERARRRVCDELDAEYRRLSALARVSPNVRADELQAIRERRDRLLDHLDDVRVRFDALRLVVMR